ncbi:MAG: glycoside hydrolase 43 family protein [Paludibacteraceae bacterium]|nr:glycoside hydrolase 43 family protein [Paludibacteraceae bacterium]
MIMKNAVFFVLSLVWIAAVHAAVPGYINPVLPYDYSDPDVCRVGDTYLMTSSSFNNVPGLQILASKDLVHWEIVDAAIRYQVPGYEEGDKVTGNFVWAPAIREHDGRIWIYYGDPDRGIYCIRSKTITNNQSPITFPLEWEPPVLVMPAKGYIDPCPLWDEDGRVYLSHGVAGSRFGLKSVLLMAELNADGLSVKVPSRIIFDGHEEHPTSEGTKLYKRNGYYYLMHPAGGVSTGWQVVQRAKNIYGPYELKITLAQGKTAINGPHQGGWVDTPDGEDWFIHFQDVGVAGRIVHLQPVKWVNDWPEMGHHGEPILSYGNHKKSAPAWANFARRDEFDTPELALDWQWAGGRLKPQWYFCDAAKGILRLYSAPREADEWMPNMLLQKIPYAAFTATARVRFVPNKDKKMEGAEQAGMIVTGRKASFKLETPVTDEWCYLRLKMTDKQKGQFYTSSDGKNWMKAGEQFQAVEGHWIGAQVGFFCTRDNRKFNDAGWMDVDWFEIIVP